MPETSPLTPSAVDASSAIATARAAGVVRSTLVVSIARVLSALLALLLGVLSARYFGTSLEKDCYVVAQTVPAILAALLVGGIYSTLLVTLAEIGQHEGLAGQKLFLKRTLWHLTAALLPLTLAAATFAPVLIHALAPGFDQPKIELGARLLRITVFSALGSLYFSGLKCLFETRAKFAAPSFMQVLTALVSLGTLVLLVDRFGIFTLAVGPLLGVFTALFWLSRLATRALHDPPGFTPRLAAPGFREQRHRRFWASFLPVCLGANVGQINLLVDNAFASFLPTGSITILGFAFVIISNAELLTTFSLAEVAFSRLAASALRGPGEMTATLRTSMRYMILLTAPLSVGALTFGVPLARLLFERGRFGPESTLGVAKLLACYAPGILLMGYLVLFSRALLARRMLGVVAWMSLASILANAALDFILMSWLGMSGIALATTGVTLIHLMALIPFARRVAPGLLDLGEGLFAAKVLASAMVMGASVFGWAWLFEQGFRTASEVTRLVEVIVGLALAAGAYAGGLHVLGIEEVRTVFKTILEPVWRYGRDRASC